MLVAFKSVFAQDSWVLRYQEFIDGQGLQTQIWLDSNSNTVITNGPLLTKVPCSFVLDRQSFEDIDSIIQRLGSTLPESALYDSNEQCNGGAVAKIELTLSSHLLESGGPALPTRQWSYNTWLQCNTFDLDPLVPKLTEKLNQIRDEEYTSCGISPL